MSTKRDRAREAERRAAESRGDEYMRVFVVLPLFGILDVEVGPAEELRERSDDARERTDSTPRADA
jgi:hypothetical protein